MMSHDVSTLRDTNVGTTDKAAHADELREAMIAELREMMANERLANIVRTAIP